MKQSLKVLVIFDSPFTAPRGYDYKKEFKEFEWVTEDDVTRTLKSLGYDVRLLGLYNDIKLLFEEVDEYQPDVIFNLAEVFKQKTHFDKNVASVLELLEIPYTGATPENLVVAGNKALSKEILTYHRIKVPRFHTFHIGQRVWLPRRLRLPVIVKPLCEEASRGISQASIVDDEQSFIQRVRFIQDVMKTDVIAEEYIDGREFYVSILGKQRLKVFPPREIKFGQFPDEERRIATYKAKWDFDYREKWGIKNVFVGRFPQGLEERIKEIGKRAFRALNLKCYARLDLRATASGEVYVIEANANPCLAKYDEFALSADKGGYPYPKLIDKIIDMAFHRNQL